LSEVLDALRAGGDLDFMRQAMQVVLQALIELEATQRIDHTPQRQAGATVVDQGRMAQSGPNGGILNAWMLLANPLCGPVGNLLPALRSGDKSQQFLSYILS
jgi:hypothetical protein